MASSNKKKSASQASRGNPANYSQIYKNAASGATPVNTAPPAAAKPGAPKAAPKAAATDAPVARVRTSDDVDWGHEYAYVLGDLKRLALVTAGLVVAIIVAGLFI